MWKRILSLSLSILLVLSVFSACGGEASTPTEPQVTEDPEEAKVLRVLNLGNSASSDACHMLNLIAGVEGFDGELYVGVLYYSGCTLPQHVTFAKENSRQYILYTASSSTPDVPRQGIEGVTMQEAITYADWDIIVMQHGGFDSGDESTYTNGNIQFIQNYVNQHKTNPNAVFAWHAGSIGSTEPDLIAMYPYTPNPYETNYEKYNYDRALINSMRMKCMQKYILTDSSFIYFIPTGTAIENAITSYLGQYGLKRDYTHLSDLGRVIASYFYYCTLTGITHLDEVKLDAIPVAFLKSITGTEDHVLTEMEKAIILESVNNALANPFDITQSQYTEAPTE